MASDDARLKSEAVAEWFWNENKTGISEEGKILIRELNKATPTIKGVRYEKKGPHIYGVKVNLPKLVIETSDGTEREMALVKVGFTQTETSKYKDDTRINTLMADIKRKIKKSWGIEANCCAIFILSIDALDTRVCFDVEAEVRSKVGIQVPKNIGKALKLPVHTEWVVTTEEFITKIRKKIESLKPEKQQEVKQPKAEQSIGEGDQSTPTSSKQKAPKKTPASASKVTPGGSTPGIKQEDVKSLAKAAEDPTLNEKALSPGGAEATPGKDETPSKSRKPATIDTDAIFGKSGLSFNKDKVNGVQEVLNDVEAYEISEVDVVKITMSNGNLGLKLKKSKNIQSG